MKNNSDNCVIGNDSYQNIYVELTDGTVGVFTGPTLIHGNPSDQIKKVSFSSPKPLPDKMTWEKLMED